MAFRSTKTFGHELGLSACFRQWRATHSHCSKLHGYALSFKFTFEGELDERNWVADFGGFKQLKEALVQTFDHKLVIAEDDPARGYFERMAELDLADVIIAPAVGCEMFAKIAWEYADAVLRASGSSRVHCISCECAEHGANSAIYIPDYQK